MVMEVVGWGVVAKGMAAVGVVMEVGVGMGTGEAANPWRVVGVVGCNNSTGGRVGLWATLWQKQQGTK
jgi:hypothetical protein